MCTLFYTYILPFTVYTQKYIKCLRIARFCGLCKHSVLQYIPQVPPKTYTGRTFIDPNFPDGSIVNAKNYCRNPDGTGLHCYTSGNVRGDCAPLIEPCRNWSKIILIVMIIVMMTIRIMNFLLNTYILYEDIYIYKHILYIFHNLIKN